MNDGYDYTAQDRAMMQGHGQGQGAGQGDADDFVVGDVAYARDADAMEADRSWKSPPVGDHEFFVSGFFKKPELIKREGYVNGAYVVYNPYKVAVKLSMVSDPTCTVIDFFDAPPADPAGVHAYLNASKNPDGKNPGFMAEKFGHFVARLGFPFAKGQPIPAEARRLANWKGRRIVATIELQDQKDNQGQARIDPTTGEPYPPKASVKLFSYRPSPSQPIATAAPQPVPQAMPIPQAIPQPVPAPPQYQAPQYQAPAPPYAAPQPAAPQAAPPWTPQPAPQAAPDAMARLRGAL